MAHKSGFINIIGNPNVGKSTIMNCMVGEKLSIITSKAQTTRHRIMGIVNGEDFQLIYSDTPGIIKPHYKLQESMMRFVKSAVEDADIILYVTDVVEKSVPEENVVEKIKNSKIPVLLLINKIDLAQPEEIEIIEKNWKEIFPDSDIFRICALSGENINLVFEKILNKLPEFPPYYPKDELTDKSERFFTSEIIREKILLFYHKEIPYSVEVTVDEFKETDKIIRIRTTIFTERDSQKRIIIGHKGSALKKVGIEARKDIEAFFGKQVYLEMFVKVNKDWRNKPLHIRRFGY